MCAVTIADPENWLTLEGPAGTLYWRASLVGQEPIGTPGSVESLEEWVREQEGNWAAVFVTSDAAYLITDQARSFPLHVALGPTTYVASTIEALRGRVPFSLNADAAAEFAHSGYVFGDDTLLDGVVSLPTSCIATLREGALTTRQYTNFYPEHSDDSEQFWHLFKEEMLASYSRLLERAGGRQLLIPLSGGIDSRLQLAVLRELDAPNVLNFTYGRAGSAEARISHRTADQAGFDWVFVEQDGERVAQAWNQPGNNGFLRHAWEGNALPHIQDWYALGRLRQMDQVDADAIVLPGHTVVGNQHNPEVLQQGAAITKAQYARALADNHFALRRSQDRAIAFSYTAAKLSTFVDAHWDDGGAQRRSDLMHHINLDNRQAKYITNSVRAYEYFGFDWALPMYERSFHELWLSGPFGIYSPDRAEYRAFTNAWFAEVTGEELEYFQVAPAPKVSRGRAQLLAIAKKLKVVDTVNFLHSVKTQLNHPMGFEGFARGYSTGVLAAKLLRGNTLMGIFAEEFLNNTWVPGQAVVPDPSGRVR